MNTLYVVLALLAVASYSESVVTTTPDPCPEAQQCSDDLKAVLTQHNVTQACNTLSTTGSCFQALEKKCPQVGYLKVSDEAIIHIDDLEMQEGCEGACAVAAEKCITDLANEMNRNTIYNLTICKTVTKSLKCLEDLKTTKCSKPVKNALLYLSKYTKENEFSDLCDDNGNPSKCFVNFNMCTKDFDTVTENTPAIKACKQIETFLECESHLPCRSSIKTLRGQVEKYLENAETQFKCPTNGTCDERAARCAGNAQAAVTKIASMTNPTSQKKQFCDEINTAVTCFDAVRNDSVCDQQSGEIGDDEKKARQLSMSICAPCDYRVTMCANQALLAIGNLNNGSATAEMTALCTDVKSAITCFDKVRKEPYCAKEEIKINKQEKEAKALYNNECGGASTVIISTALMFLSLAVSGLKSYL